MCFLTLCFFTGYFFIDCYNLLSHDSAVQVHDIGSTSCRLPMLNCQFDCQRQCVWIMGTNTATLSLVDDLGHITYVRRDDRYIARHGFFDYVW